MMPEHILHTLYRRNRLLSVVGWLHLVAFVATLLLVMIDDRQVLGISTWVKPMKFMFSLTVYLWTIAWFSEYINRPRWRIRTISVVITVIIIIESACILIQAGRGTTSHYNFATDFDAAVFQTMGAMIAIDMLMGVIILFMFSKPRVDLDALYLWGIRIGLAMFLVGGFVGMAMIANNAHTFGAPDGGPGLPILNWSTTAGDMRIAHGLALHAMQVIPLAAYWIGSTVRIEKKAARYCAFIAFTTLYALAIYWTYMQALAGRPFL
jgi:hypothetical protein